MDTRTHRAITRLEVDTATRGPVRGLLHLTGWHGRSEHDVEIVGETPKRYRVRLLETMRLPSRRIGQAGDVVLVPKYSITLKEQP